MDDCDCIMALGLAGVSSMSILNDFNETVTYGKDMFHFRIAHNFSILTIDSTTADNQVSTLGTGTNDLENDAGAYTNLCSGQVRELLDSLAIPLILVSLLPLLVVLIVAMNPVLRNNNFLIVILEKVLMMKLILIVTPRRRSMRKIILIVTLVWLRTNLSH